MKKEMAMKRLSLHMESGCAATAPCGSVCIVCYAADEDDKIPEEKSVWFNARPLGYGAGQLNKRRPRIQSRPGSKK